jgi:hypothetical protein
VRELLETLPVEPIRAPVGGPRPISPTTPAMAEGGTRR